MIERLAAIVRALTLQNVLLLALLVLIGLPVFLIYRLGNDRSLREQFLSSIRVVDGLGVPCLVVASNMAGQPERLTVGVSFESDGRIEFDIVARSPGVLSGQEIATACEQARKYRDIMRKALGSPSETH